MAAQRYSDLDDLSLAPLRLSPCLGEGGGLTSCDDDHQTGLGHAYKEDLGPARHGMSSGFELEVA